MLHEKEKSKLLICHNIKIKCCFFYNKLHINFCRYFILKWICFTKYNIHDLKINHRVLKFAKFIITSIFFQFLNTKVIDWCQLQNFFNKNTPLSSSLLYKEIKHYPNIFNLTCLQIHDTSLWIQYIQINNTDESAYMCK